MARHFVFQVNLCVPLHVGILMALIIKSITANHNSALLKLNTPQAMQTRYIYQIDQNWHSSSVEFGQASSVAVTPSGHLILFHRQNRTISKDSFGRYKFKKPNLPPIPSNTIYVVDSSSGKIIHEWGSDLFYMPHSLTMAPSGDIFTTDVILHQVFKFKAESTTPSLILGTAFEEGKDDHHFCGPTAVAVAVHGDFFVADGYCNSRIIKFNSHGRKLFQIGQSGPPVAFGGSRIEGAFNIVHALALAEDQDLICAADRENGRIVCFGTFDGVKVFTIEAAPFGGRIFSIAYSPAGGGAIIAVNGPNKLTKTQGFVIPLTSSTKEISTTFDLSCKGFQTPHSIAVTADAKFVYVTDITEPHKIYKFQRNETNFGNAWDTAMTNCDDDKHRRILKYSTNSAGFLSAEIIEIIILYTFILTI